MTNNDHAIDLLIVDDDPVTRNKLAMVAQAHGIQFRSAADGAEAWAMYQAQPARIVVSDVEMPAMDGLELLTQIRLHAAQHYAYVILLTGHTAPEEVARGMAAGADDYLSKPFSPEHLVGRLRVADRITRLQADLRTANAALANELTVAAQVQASLLPAAGVTHPGFTCAWQVAPCAQLAGDLLDFLPLDADHLAGYVLDVAGHGAAASLLSVQLSRMLRAGATAHGGLLRTQPQNGSEAPADPDQVLHALNRMFPMVPPANQFFTMTYVVINRRTGTLRYSVGGHPTPAVVGHDGHVRSLDGNGTMLGLGALGRYDTYETQLSPGDTVVLYSDGIIETRRPGDAELFGWRQVISHLQAHYAQHPIALLSAVTSAADAWRGDSEREDDCSICAIRWDGPDSASATST